ncbi:MAG: tRNA pseudouridine(55) synthase TruB [Stomatobaculum sp.]
MLNGVINVYKERGYTSHDVVAKLRGILHQKKIGHTGTLDPDAEGVLPVCVGSATKLCDMLTDRSKTYRATLLLGRTTDTQDVSGKIYRESAVHCTEDELRDAVLSFTGDYDQLPPMYSALKVGGQKLVDLARRGIEVERQTRRVRIHAIEIEEISLPRVIMTVDCSKGTYIRTLCHDIGERLGCGGCMETLLRTRSGRFELSGALRLSAIEALSAAGETERWLMPTDRCLDEYPAVRALPEADRLLHNGNPVPAALCAPPSAGEHRAGSRCRVYDSSGVFTGLYRLNERAVYRPEKMFCCAQDIKA